MDQNVSVLAGQSVHLFDTFIQTKNSQHLLNRILMAICVILNDFEEPFHHVAKILTLTSTLM